MPRLCSAYRHFSVAFLLAFVLPVATFGNPIIQNYLSIISPGSSFSTPTLSFINPSTGNVTTLCSIQYAYMSEGAVLPGYDEDMLVFLASEVPGAAFVFYSMPPPSPILPPSCANFEQKSIPGPIAIPLRYGVDLGVFFTETAPANALQVEFILMLNLS